MTQAALSCQHLEKHFGELKAVCGVDLEVLRGECFGLLGPNGAGKTTTVEMLEGLSAPTAGSITLLGHPLNGNMPYDLRARIGVQLQETELADKMNVAETIRLFRSFYPDGRTVEEVIDMLGLNASRRHAVGKLSGGQRQRLALACALVSRPEILFLDEPTTGLDPQARLRIWEVVSQFCESGGTVMLTTHYMEEAYQLCDRVAIMDHGRIIACDTPAQLIAELDADQIITFSTQPEFAPDLLDGITGIVEQRRHNGDTILAVRRIHETLPVLLAAFERNRVQLKTLTTKQPSLEDVFVHHTGRGLRDE